MRLIGFLVLALIVSGCILGVALGSAKSSKKGGKGSKSSTASDRGLSDKAIGTSKAKLPTGADGNYDYLKVTKKKEVLLEEAIMQVST